MTASSSQPTCATTCPYCGVGCGVVANTDHSQPQLIVGDTSHPANQGKLCIKGSTLADTQAHPDRLLQPCVHGAEVSMDTALDAVAEGFRSAIKEHGADSVAFYLSGQLLTEDYYVANKLMKGFIGSANVDTNSRLCMASAVAAHKRAFGEDVVPCNYDDLDHCDLLLMIGSNAAWTHPVLYQRIARAKAQGNLNVVVIDPRRSATCEIADLHLAIKPGSDVALFNGLLTYLAEHQAMDQSFVRQHTSGVTECLKAAQLSLSDCALATGLEAGMVQAFFEQFAASTNTVSFFSQGVNQSIQGTDKANAIINSHLLTGRIGKPGSGPFSITGQPNAMGGREVGGMASQLAAHMDFIPAHIDRVSRFWGTERVAQRPGLKAVELFDAVDSGQIKALWIMGTNPVVSLPNPDAVRRALKRCPLVVVSDCVANTDTVRMADIALPARGWGEKDGTVTNSERTISRQRRFAEPPGAAQSDWAMICAVAARMGYGEAFAYRSAREIFIEHAALTGFENDGKRLLDLSTLAQLSPVEYDQLAPTQWPRATRPFADGRFSTDDQRAQFIATTPAAPAQQPSTKRPLIANSGRIRDQWHTMTRTGTSARLFSHRREPFVELSAADAAKAGLTDGDLVDVAGASGRFRGIARLDETVSPGQIFLPIHWSSTFSSRGLSNVLIEPCTDPVSGQPESKHGAVAITKVAVRHWLRVVTASAFDQHLLEAWNTSLAYWSRTTATAGTVYDAALTESVQTAIEHLEALTDSDQTLRLQDNTAAAPITRVMGLTEGQPRWLLSAVAERSLLPTDAQLLKGLMSESAPWQALALESTSTADKGPMICTCFEVHRDDIVQAIGAGNDSVPGLGSALSCGTNCGSCVPELQQLIRSDLASVKQ